MAEIPIGVGLPQASIGTDPSQIRDFVQSIEGMGFSHIVMLEHVLAPHPFRPGGKGQPSATEPLFHEPLTFLARVAANTKRLGLMPGILILPQRQTVLAAKQATELDILSGGRLRLGVSVGWSEVEYKGLESDFHTRGRRLDAQISLLRRLWSEPVIEEHDRWHTINKAGINPRPERPIPIWVGGSVDASLRRAARLADGWYPQASSTPTGEWRKRLERLHLYLREAGRDPATFPIEARVNFAGGDPQAAIEATKQWIAAGITHIQVTTRDSPTDHQSSTFPAAEHLKAFRTFKEAWDSNQQGSIGATEG
jgi:probable F420-dependent oxidoreductase